MNDNHEIYDVQTHEPVTTMQAEKTNQEDAMVWKDKVTAEERVENEPLPWFEAEEINEIKSRWSSVQTEFVDDPHSSIKQADDLVAEAIERFEQALYHQRSELVEQWNTQDDISTEELRIALQSYRSFLDRLLAFQFSSS